MNYYRPIKEIFDFEKGSLQSSKAVDGEYNFITASSEWKKHNTYEHDKEALIIAVAASGSLGRVHYINGKFTSSDLCFILTPKDQKTIPVDLQFYQHLFQSIRQDLVQATATGTSKLAINQENFGNYKVPYFDIEHQKKYRRKFVKLEEQQFQFKSQIDNQKTNLKNLRKQILQDAIEGKLTKEWRENNPDIEPASELLKKIKKEKEKLIAEKKIKKEKPLPPIEQSELPFELPKNWVWVRLGEIGLVNRGKSPKYDEGSNAFSLNQKCVRWNYIDTIFAKEIKSDWLSKIDKSFLTQVGDILVNSTGEGTIGRSAVVDEISNKMIFDSHVLCFRGIGSINTKFFTSVINSSFGQFQINESKGAKSTKQTELGVTNLRNIFSPLPPLSEQLAIVSKLQTSMQKLDEAEKQIENSLETSKLLTKAILTEAFQNHQVKVN